MCEDPETTTEEPQGPQGGLARQEHDDLWLRTLDNQ